MKNVTHLLAFVPIMLFVSCTQDTEPPILAVSTSSADVSRETISVGLSASAVVSSGSKNILKTIPECGFYYGDDESLSKGGKVTASMNDDGSFSASVLPEEFGKTYYYQAYLNNGLGDNKSRNISNFRTLEFEEYINLQSPQISFVPASGSATATVRLSTAEGLHLTDRGICYGETESPDDEWTTISAGSGDTDFAVTVGQLQIGKKYHARSFARLGDNIAYSDIVSFNTDAPFKGLKITPSKDWTLVPGNSLDFQVFKINNDDTETEVTSSVSWEYSTGTLSQNSVAPSRFTGTAKGSAYVKATYTESDWTENIQSDGMVTEATVIKTEYGKPQISLEINKDIPACGDTINLPDATFCTVSYHQNKTIYLSDGSKTTETVTSPATVTFSPDKISGPNLKDTVTLRRIVDSIHVTVIMNGQDSTVSAPVFQQENSVVDCTFKEPVVSVTVKKDIPASGGSVNQQDCTVSYYQIKTTLYTSRHEKEDTLTTDGQVVFDPNTITAESTTNSQRSKVGVFTVTVSMNGKSGFASADVFQEGYYQEITYEDPVVSVTANKDIPAGGGTFQGKDCIVTYSQIKKTPDGNETLITEADSIIFSADVQADSLGTTIKERTKVGSMTATVYMNGKSGSCSADVYQEANSVTGTTYGIPIVQPLNIKKNIPASGGTTSIGDYYDEPQYSQTETKTYTSGASDNISITSGATITYTDVTAESLGSTIKGLTLVGYVTAKVTMNGKEGQSEPAAVFQEANSVTGTTYGIPIVQPLNIKKDIPAGGGTTSLGDYYDEPPYSQTETTHYTSGDSTSVTITSGATITYSVVTANSLGTNIKERTQVGTVTATVSMNGKEGLSEPAAVFQQENKIEAADIQLPKSVLILDEETDATAAITFTSGATLYQGDSGVSLSAENNIVASCSNTGHIIGKSSTTNNDYDYFEGQSTNIVLSYHGVPKTSAEITVVPKLMKLITDKTFSIRVNNWVSFDVQVQFQNIYNGSALNQAVTNYTDSLSCSYEPYPTSGGGWIKVQIECDQRRMSVTEKGEAQVYFSGSKWGQGVESDHNITIKGYWGSPDPKD